MKEGDCYRYLGVYENIRFVARINEDRILKEYTNSIVKLWSSNLSDSNKVAAILQSLLLHH